MTRRLFAVLAAVATAITIVACSSTSQPSSAQAPGEAVPAQLQFTAKTLDGQEFAGETLLGKPAVLWFWAPWCPACQSEAPMVGQAAKDHPAVTFLGVAAQDQLPAMKAFVEKYPVKSFAHLADTNGIVWAKFGVTSQPAFAFINANGEIDVVKGSMSEAELTQRVGALTDK